MRRTLIISFAIILGLAAAGFLGLRAFRTSNHWGASRLGEIPAPVGYVRTDDGDKSYNEFLRGLPLKEKGAKVHLFTGGIASYQFLSAGVIDLPNLSNDEQCADVTMRLRAEHLWEEGRYKDICFTDVGGKKRPYTGGESRSAFEKYMRMVYGVCNTSSVYSETKVRELKEIRPGDVFVYSSRRKGAYGHAVLVADVARGRGGKTAVICIEGNTPAREMHIVRSRNPFRNPWHILDEKDHDYFISVFRFGKDELRHY